MNDVNYDDAGNVIGFPLMSARMTYDAENRLTSSQTANSATVMYGYDGQGRRVSKTAAGLTTYYVYDTGDGLLAEYGGPSNATVAGTVYQTEDHLGSTRAVTDAAGNIVSRSDYLPFGETIAGTATFNRNQIIGYGPPAADLARVYGACGGYGNGAGLFWDAVFQRGAQEVYNSGQAVRGPTS